MALVDARGFQLSPNVVGSFGQGVNVKGEMQRQQLEQQQALAQQQQAQAALDKQARLQGILGRLGAGQQPQAPGAQPAQALPQLGQQGAQPAQPAQLGAQQVPGAQPAQLGAQQAPQIPFGNPRAMAELAIQFPEEFEKINVNLGLITQQQKDEAADFSFRLRGTPFDQRGALIDQREASVRARGGDPTNTASLRDMPEEAQNQALELTQIAALSGTERQKVATGDRDFGLEQQKFGLSQQEFGLAKKLAASTIAERAKPTEATAGQKEFDDLTKGLTVEQKNQARLIKLGLSPRAVGSAIQTISEQGLAEVIGDVEAIINERKKFGELTGASRAKSIDSGFETIRKIDKNVLNLDRAISAVEAGAGTGVIERRFPSIKAASVLLDNIQGELALDVIGAVTFGALSSRRRRSSLRARTTTTSCSTPTAVSTA